MKNVIGLHFWESKALISFLNGDSISTTEIELSYEVKRSFSLTNEYTLTSALKYLDRCLREKFGFDDYEVVLAVPDYIGVRDSGFIRMIAAKCGMKILRTISETMALAAYVYLDTGEELTILTTVVNTDYLSISEYDIGKGKIKKIDTYLSSRWDGKDIANSLFINSYSSRLFDTTIAETLCLAGNMVRCMEFEQAVKRYSRNIPFEIAMFEANHIIEGLSILAAKECDIGAFDDIEFVDTTSPYDIFIGINDTFLPVFSPETKVPAMTRLSLPRIVESKVPYETIRLFEKKKDEILTVSEVKIPKDKIESFYRKPLSLSVDIDEAKNTTLEILDNDTMRSMTVSLVVKEDDETEKSEEAEDISHFIKEILPIIDNLEYAVRFSNNDDNPYIKGMIQSYQKALDILEKNHITVITGEGEPFDYNLQAAVSHVDDPSLPDNTVKQVMQSGYTYKGKVIRPAAVVVAN